MTESNGRLVLHVRQKDGIFGTAKGAEPQAQLDGRPIPVGWGRNDLSLPPGRSRLQLAVRHGNRVYGLAQTEVSTTSGQQRELFYAPPLWAILGGRFGDRPQPFRGKIALVAILIVVLLVLVAGIATIVAVAVS